MAIWTLLGNSIGLGMAGKSARVLLELLGVGDDGSYGEVQYRPGNREQVLKSLEKTARKLADELGAAPATPDHIRNICLLVCVLLEDRALPGSSNVFLRDGMPNVSSNSIYMTSSRDSRCSLGPFSPPHFVLYIVSCPMQLMDLLLRICWGLGQQGLASDHKYLFEALWSIFEFLLNRVQAIVGFVFADFVALALDLSVLLDLEQSDTVRAVLRNDV